MIRIIIELKIWHGDIRHEEAIDQLSGYMRIRNAGSFDPAFLIYTM